MGDSTEYAEPETVRRIRAAVAGLGDGAISDAGVRAHIAPLFSRALARNEIYLANHSLGRPLDALAEDLHEFSSVWYENLDGAWDDWLAERDAFRARVARLIGCARSDAIIPKTAAGQGLRAVLNALPMACPRVVATRGEFDSIDHILKTYAFKGRAEVRWVGGCDDGLFAADDIIGAIKGGADLVFLPPVFFVSGQILEGLDRVIEAAHDAGALIMLDCYHAAGVIEVGFDRLGADFAIGGSYKYARGGPGACWLAVREGLLRAETEPQATPDGLVTLDTGWFAREHPFSYERSDEPRLAPGGDAWLESTPPVAAYYQARAGLELVLAIGVERLRADSKRRQAILADLLADRSVPTHPIEPRGAYLLVPVDDGPTAADRVRVRGVATDARPCPVTGQHFLRLCPDLLNTEAELIAAAGIIAGTLAQGSSAP